MLGDNNPAAHEDGFTLVELLVVVVIIGILSGIAIPTYLSQREQAWASALQAELRNAAIEMEAFYADADQYPSTSERDDSQQTDGRVPVVGFAVGAPMTLTIADPSSLGATQHFCIQGAHATLNGGAVSFSYDSDGGGVVAGDAC